MLGVLYRDRVWNLSNCVIFWVAVTIISSAIMETRSSATRATSKLKLNKTKAPAVMNGGGWKETAKAAVIAKDITEVKDKEEVTDVIIKDVTELEDKEKM